MTNIPRIKEEYRQDALQHIDHWLNALEKLITALLSTTASESMKRSERERLAGRFSKLRQKLLKQRQKYVQLDHSAENAALLDRIPHTTNEMES